MSEPITVFILSWERPIYLWVTLDSLYRHTKHPARFIIVDSGSRDPMVAQVIEGFQRRGMFLHTELLPENDPKNFERMLEKYAPLLGKYFGCVESDVEVLPSDPCWLGAMAGLMDRTPDLHYLGSLIDRSDFVSVEQARRLAPHLDEDHLRLLVKAKSAERAFTADDPAQELNTDYMPPGRLTLYRTFILSKVPMMADGLFSKAVIRAGGQVGVALKARHRHLSLLHVFDYPDYDVIARNHFMTAMSQR